MLHKAEDLNEAILKELPEREQKLYRLVFESVTNNQLLTDQLRSDDDQVGNRTFGERMADSVAQFGGSWAFIGSFLVCMTAWMLVNVVLLTNKGFDPYPFILLNLVLSCVAALQAPVIMMSQNRKDQRDRHRAEDDYLINLKAEIEIRHLHQKLEELHKNQMELQRELHQVVQTNAQTRLETLQTDVARLQAALDTIAVHLQVPAKA